MLRCVELSSTLSEIDSFSVPLNDPIEDRLLRNPRGRLPSLTAVLSVVAVITASLIGANSTAAQDEPTTASRDWRVENEHAVVRQLADLVALPNVATDPDAIEANVFHLIPLLERRGFETPVLWAGEARPAVFGERRVPGAERTVLFYRHYDGQPVDIERWASDPWTPGLRSEDGKSVDCRSEAASAGSLDPEARRYGRSAGDDKGPVVALMAAIDALDALSSDDQGGFGPSVNLKIFLEGEEEVGSPHLRKLLAKHRDLHDGDIRLFADGPVHASRRQQVIFGVRGVTGVEVTLYGPARPLHSGHYGNWAPNPAADWPI